MSVQFIMIFAFLSALSRAGLNIVDRYQIGMKKLSIFYVNLWNNVIPAILMIALCILLGWHGQLVASIFDWKTLVFSGIVQLVAYAFSYAFRHLNVSQVLVIGKKKMSDLFIPIGIFVTTMQWDWSTYFFAVATTIVCLPILWEKGERENGNAFKKVGLIIGSALVLQASLSPLLTEMNTVVAIRDTFAFTTAVIIWRTVWSLIPLLRKKRAQDEASFFGLLSNPVFFVRALLTIITQTTFILAVGSTASAVAWPILNSTSIFSVALSSLLLREKPSKLQIGIVITITILSVIRFFLL
ncbi:hypothetical protein K6959_07460 [Bacillus aquiflavi]|uniref:hypothetical protein n=1 Tax=Bacillus aquiflavi TaxID=2672567 RepID=UPI001CA9ABAD|nr:hypothetical protein [Bacillus aquiflavi]UAC49633.1 hypothetical protein K6959_07460 [Bacillus aquiflavi]